MSADLAGDGFRLRPAGADDVDFLVALMQHEEVEPFIAAVRPKDREAVLADIRQSLESPSEHGRWVIEVRGDPSWRRAGALGFDVANTRSRTARLGGLAVHPEFRGRRLADRAAQTLQRHLFREIGFHRLELECYGFNERAIEHAERCGFIREGVKRKAYWRHGDWVDGVLFGMLEEDLPPRKPPG